jgi:hypothetical protein
MRRAAGSLDELYATLDIQYPEVTVDDGRTVTRTLPDHVLLSGRFASGATLSMEVLGGRPADRTPFRLEIFGDRGELTILGGAPRGFQAGLLTLQLSGEVQVDAEPGFPDLAPSAVNVARVYEALRDDIVDGTTTAPTLDQAARLARLLEDVGIGTAFTG